MRQMNMLMFIIGIWSFNHKDMMKVTYYIAKMK